MKKKNIQVLLIGVGSLRNYGCEGIVQGTYAMFRKFWPECELVVATENPNADRITFAGYENIRFIKDAKRVTLYRLWKGFLRRFLKIGKGSAVRINTQLVKGKDIFLSCGGDNFCESPDGTLYFILQDLMTCGVKAKQNDSFYALWGASVGPFNSINEPRITSNLQLADLIFVREKLAYSYVNSIGISAPKLKLIADPAFCMSPDMSHLLEKKDDDIFIGLNISALAFSSVDYATFGQLLSIDPKVRLLCIPHVMSSRGGPQDDFLFLQNFIRSLNHSENRIILLPENLGARKTKGCIAQCDILIASRMHACVAGVSVGTPTLFLTYSNKGKGMAEYVYGHQDWTLSNKRITESDLLNKVQKMLKKKEEIKQYLMANHIRFKEDASLSIIELKKNYFKE